MTCANALAASNAIDLNQVGFALCCRVCAHTMRKQLRTRARTVTRAERWALNDERVLACVRVRACVVGWSEARVLGGADACAAQMLGVYLVSGVMVLISIVMALVSAGSHAQRPSLSKDGRSRGRRSAAARRGAGRTGIAVAGGRTRADDLSAYGARVASIGDARAP